MTHRPASWNGQRVPYEATLHQLELWTRTAGPEGFAAFVALAHHEGREAVEILIDRCYSEDDRLRRAAVEALGHREERDLFVEVVRDCLADSDARVRIAACETAARVQMPELRGPIRELLSVRDATIRAAAVTTLRTVWRPHDFGPVFRLLRSDSATDVRDAAAWTLRAVTPSMTTRDARALFAVWHKADLARHRQWACEVAAEFELHAELVPVRELLQDRDGHVRLAAERALATLAADE